MRRANSVRLWLAEKGIEIGRLDAWGCGENLPIDSNKTNAGRQANRRVEFHIEDPAPEGVERRSREACDDANGAEPKNVTYDVPAAE